MKITIVGAGAIGGILGAHLIKAGHDVTFVEAHLEHAKAIRENGLKVTGAADLHVYPQVLLPEEVDSPLEVVFLAVKARHTEEAMKTVARHLAQTGYVLSLQNGLEEYKIAQAVGNDRTVGAFLTFGGSYQRPGEVAFSGTGSFYIGEMDGRPSERLFQLQQVLSALQPVTITDNIFGYLWGKVAVGAFYFATALVNADVTDIIDQVRYRKALGNLVGEVANVGAACGISCEVIDGFDPKVFARRDPSADLLNASWNAQKQYWNSIVQKRTGVWRDLAIHRRPTEVDGIVGTVIQRANEKEIAVPRLECLVKLIKEVERGERELSWANLDVLREVDENFPVQ
jgi:2-dehydropantoate 2-reductase